MTPCVNLAEISNTDYTSAVQINAAGHLLLSLLQHHGGFGYPVVHTPELNTVRRQCEIWLQKTASHAPVLPAGEVLQALPFYDLLHRVIFCRPGASLINRQFERAFRTFLGGDSSVDEVSLMQTIGNGLRFGDEAYSGAPRVWFDSTLRYWFNDIRHTVDTGAQKPSAADFDKAAVLLGENLASLTPRQQHFKEKISRHYLSHCANAQTADSSPLLSMLRFTGAALNLSPLDDHITALRQHLITLLTSSPTLSSADRAAFTLDLAALTHAHAV